MYFFFWERREHTLVCCWGNMGGEEKMNCPLGFLVCLRLFIGVFCVWWCELKLAICLLHFAINSSSPCVDKSPCRQQTFSPCFAQFTHKDAKRLSWSGRLAGHTVCQASVENVRRYGQEEMVGKSAVAKGMTLKKLQHLPSSRSKSQRARRWLSEECRAYPAASQQDPSGSPAPSALLGQERDPSKEWAACRPTEPLHCFPNSCCSIPWTKQSTLPIRENHLFRNCSITIVTWNKIPLEKFSAKCLFCIELSL